MFTDKRKNLLALMREEGAITVEEGTEIYSEPAAFYRAVKDLREMGMVERVAAPPRAPQEYAFKLTRTGTIISKEI